MKKIAISIFLVLAVFAAVAQVDSASWKQELPRHDLQLGIGDPIIAGVTAGVGLSLDALFSSDDFASEGGSIDELFATDAYCGTTLTTGCLSLAYRYRLQKWLWVGVSGSYAGFYANIYDKYSNQKKAMDASYFFFLMPSVRFSWLNQKYVMLYSGVSLGVSGCYSTTYSKFDDKTSKNISINFAGELTAVGVHVGRYWYGFTELGFGTQGFFNIGFGYQFKSKKK